jgi:hypothetical protein
MLALTGVGLVAIEVAGKIGGDATRKRFQWSIIAAAAVLLAVNIVNFLRPVWCYDFFFPYGLPFTLFPEGGYAGGAGFLWTGLVADAALNTCIRSNLHAAPESNRYVVGEKSRFHSNPFRS